MQTQVSNRLDASFGSYSLGDLLLWAKDQLEVLGKDEALVNSERLLAEITGFNRSSLYLEINRPISRDHAVSFRNLVAKRKSRIPLAYLTGKAFFWDEILEVGPGCLIPRPETEILVEKFITHSGFEPNEPFHFLDLGAGSGAIGIALLRYFEKANAVFSDISQDALTVTFRNLERYDLLNRSRLVCSDLFHGFGDQKWQAIISNPPYLSHEDLKKVEPEILQEPRQALDGGEDGLDFYRRIIDQSLIHLVPGGWLVFEIGQGQALRIQDLLEKHQFKNIQCFKDHAAIERVIMAKR